MVGSTENKRPQRSQPITTAVRVFFMSLGGVVEDEGANDGGVECMRSARDKGLIVNHGTADILERNHRNNPDGIAHSDGDNRW